ncbi:P-loop containing nucleoside triphosphate hydrolase protein [Rhizophagus irregularis]|uniref:P-loop containing nucleoside triphosphate hydrolase protein n=1 Tax=Rhizophagus irregularis TaxID=588596 RepID=A0A2I1HH28_9GLOM|nr:P-loop containing nucleoside triphosphate hydrolase protein [Rhizophagus irregularis]
MKKLGQLSLGEWDRHELRRTVQTHTIPVYEIELPNSDGLKILWQVDYGFSIRSDSLTQLVKIWAVTANKKQIREILENLLIVHQVYISKHLCVVQQENEDNVILPMTFEDEEETESPENGLHNSLMDDDRLLGVHKMLVTNKFVPLSRNLYKSLALGGFNFTFQVSKKEYEIINNPTSAIIIGRSGTGKTTCVIFRQIASYLNRQLCKTSSNDKTFNIRQIFITLSPNLCHRVKEYFNRLRESAMLAGKKISMTQFYEYKRKKEEEEVLDGIDSMFEEGNEEDDIPNSFHELADHHFPLFITYDKFSKMLQETYGIKSITKQRNLDAENDIDSYDKENFYQKSSSIKTTNFVDYKVFQRRYWHRLNCDFDCELVYAEFSIIKGSNPEVDFLSREDYKSISIKKYPVFSYDRDRIYDLFEKYEAEKARNGHYDSIDRTLAILRLAKKKALGGPHIHEVYIDECQDNQIVDLTLILKVFDRVNNIFLAGDIAQCIAQGSSFRFEDLYALMYNWERTRVKINHSNVDINPKRFELDINYRSHNGILKLASSIIDLIWHFFPNSIDRLSREHSKVCGPQPVFYDEFQKDDLLDREGSELDDDYTHRRVDGDENPFIEFGADQVIIVRDNKAKMQVEKLINKAGLVMTVFETKGMEFNDVLLYNFFTDSPACRKWRVILSALNENSKGIQTFSHERHYILSSEFKNLYVAVTRARQRLWICDENIEYSMPIRKYWKRLDIIKTEQSKGGILSNFAKKSESYEWNQRGKNFFEQRQYEQAIFCFVKSGNEERRKLANAYNLQQIAKDSINDSDDDTIITNFNDAIKAFKECSRPGQAALCYQYIGMYKEAGDVYVEHNMFESAARSYLKANLWHKAYEYFEKAKKYDDAALAYKDGFLKDSLFYEIAIKFMLKYKQKISKKAYCNIAHHIKIYYHATAISYGKFEEAVEVYKKLINNYEDIKEILEFLLYICRINILNEIMVSITDSSTLQHYLSKINELIVKMESQLIRKSDKWNDLMEEYNLYTAYLDKDINKTYECIQYFRRRKKLATEFYAVNIWLQILLQLSEIQIKNRHRERLHYLLWMCELALPFIRNIVDKKRDSQIEKNFEDIFCIKEANDPQKRQIPFSNPLLHVHEYVGEAMNNQRIYSVNNVHLRISQCLASRIFELIWDANKKGRDIPDISSQICYKFTSCERPNCLDHHVITTPSILHNRLELAFLQYTVMLKLDVLYRHRLLKEEQSKEVRRLQRWWAESLVKFHIRYQSPQISCPEVTCIVLSSLSDCTRKEFIKIARKIWLYELNNNVSNFEVMLKCMFVFQQLKNKWGINTFDWEMSKTKKILSPNNLPIGFEYRDVHNGYHRAIPVGKRLSLFFHHLKFDHVIEAILNIKVFIQYAISKNQKVNLVTSDAFGDLVSLMEFATSLIFAVSPRCCDFFLPRSYLVNYFDTYSAVPLFPKYDRKDYLTAVKNSFDQVQQLLELLICKERLYLLVILRLIRLLILIGLNESTFITRVFSLFKYLNNKVSFSSAKIKKYLKQKSKESVINVLYNDLKETGCDSLIIVYYQLEDIPSKISKWEKYEKYGIIKLTYNSAKDFRSALQQIKSSIVAGGNVISKNQSQSQSNESSDKNTDLTDTFEQLAFSEEVQVWLSQMHNCPKTQEAARKIQVWFRRVYKRVKFRSDYDTILNEIYNDMTIFCHALMEEKGKKAVSKYNILLKGQTVDIIAELIMLQSKMEVIENRLKKTITDHPSDTDEIDSCLELEDELRYNQYEKVELALKSLSITENSSKYKEANIEWLENELHQAEDSIDRVWECIDECKAEISLFYFTEDFVSKKISKSQNSTSYGDCDDWQ